MFVFNPIVWLLTLMFAFAFIGVDRAARWGARHARSWHAGRHALHAAHHTT